MPPSLLWQQCDYLPQVIHHHALTVATGCTSPEDFGGWKAISLEFLIDIEIRVNALLIWDIYRALKEKYFGWSIMGKNHSWFSLSISLAHIRSILRIYFSKRWTIKIRGKWWFGILPNFWNKLSPSIPLW